MEEREVNTNVEGAVPDPSYILPEFMRSRTYYGEQDENGVDLSIIRENLRRTPAERLLRAERAWRDAMEVREHVRHQRRASA